MLFSVRKGKVRQVILTARKIVLMASKWKKLLEKVGKCDTIFTRKLIRCSVRIIVNVYNSTV